MAEQTSKADRVKLNRELAQMLKGGVIMDVTTPEQARIAEEAGACLLGDTCLLGRGDVHDDAALEHLRELAVEFDAIGLAGLFCHGCSLG